MEEQNLEQLFQSNLSDLESGVHPDAWKNIKKELKNPELPASGISTIRDTTTISKRVTLKLIILIAAFSVGLGIMLNSLVKKQPVINAISKESNGQATLKAQSTEISKPSRIEQAPLVNNASQKQIINKESEQKPSQTNAFALRTKEKKINVDNSTTKINMLTPNGDGESDYFKPPVEGSYKEYELTIYDAKGHEVFKAKDSSATWDGKLNTGQPAPADVYTYTVNAKDLTGKGHLYQGSIALIR